jgi:hypothetical protein
MTFIDFNNPPNPLYDSVSRVYKSLSNSKLTNDQLDSCKNDLEFIARFFLCNQQQAAVLAFLLKFSMQTEAPSVTQILKHVGLSAAFSNPVHQVLAPFVERNLIKPQKNIHFHPLCTYKLSRKLLRAFHNMDLTQLEERAVRNTVDLAEKIDLVIQDRSERIVEPEDAIRKIESLFITYNDIPLSEKVIEHRVQGLNLLVLGCFCAKFVTGVDELDFSDLVESLQLNRQTRYQLQCMLREQKGVLFSEGFIERSERDSFIGKAQYKLCFDIQGLFDGFNHYSKSRKQEMAQGFIQVIEPASIAGCALLYNRNEEKMVADLHKILQGDTFEVMKKSMAERGMKGGLTVLFHGEPGTGKTETALQLSRISDRPILQVDASAIRSKWVGETEKNLSTVFREYERITLKSKKTPILLFNEADSLLTIRVQVKERGDHYENAIQSLLLQLLERFDGIFIGTTNLTKNLDGAFHRRMLFKIKFEKPSVEVRTALLEMAFPELSQIERNVIAAAYEMTGSEIMNVKRKAIIEEILQQQASAFQIIDQLCRQELSLDPDSEKNRIGFRRA